MSRSSRYCSLGPNRGPKTFYRWQKGKLILLASLSCWIIFTLPLGFFQPPGAKCMVWRNNSYWLDDAGQPVTRIKRSIDNNQFYEAINDEDDGDLEVAANVVFERMRRSTNDDDDDDIDDNSYSYNKHENKFFRIQRSNRIQRQTQQNYDSVDDVNSKQNNDQTDSSAKDIDFRSIAKSNRPADVLEYKRFLKNEPLDETRPPKKAYSYTKVRSKPVKTKIMVERSIDADELEIKETEIYEGKKGTRKLMFLSSKENNELQEIMENINEEEANVPLVRRRRSMRAYRTSGGMSPMSVSFAANYDPVKHSGLVKPRYSTVVYRLSQTEDPHQVAEATHLAPHGVPSNAIPRALSSSRLHEMAQEPSYGATYQTAGGNLGVPGGNQGGGNPTNPFLNSSGGGGGGGGGTGGYNYGMTGKGEDEFIRRSFQVYSEVVGSEFEIVKPPPVVTHLHAQQPCTNPFHQHDYDW